METEITKHLSTRERIFHTIKTLRWWAVLPVPIGVIIINSFGPDGWREPANHLLLLSWASIFAAMAHAARRILLPASDSKAAWAKLMENPIGAGLGYLSITLFTAIIFFGLVSLARAEDVKTYVPLQARPLLPQLRTIQQETMPTFAYPSYFGSLIEQESCISLTHSKCWNSRSQLKTDREEGAGLGQFTRAWKTDGTLRFDAIAEVRALDPVALKDFSWSTVYARADLSMKAIIVKFRDCYVRMDRQSDAGAYDLMAFCDAAYNGGLGGMLADRRLCDGEKGCDANRWFGNVDAHSLKSRQKWQGYGKSAFDINREHVVNALTVRRTKYQAVLGPDLS